jgi:hypothetical protein
MWPEDSTSIYLCHYVYVIEGGKVTVQWLGPLFQVRGIPGCEYCPGAYTDWEDSNEFIQPIQHSIKVGDNASLGKPFKIQIHTAHYRPPLWSSGQSSWLLNGDVLCFL